MSSSDSDYSIDWLASDEEDAESEQNLLPRPDCLRRPTSTTTASTSTSSSSSSSFACGGKRCPSPPSSEDSQASSCARRGFCEDSDTVREEEEEEEEEERGVVGLSDGSTCSSPSSCTGSCDGAEERLGAAAGAGGASGGDRPRHLWATDSSKKRLTHKRARSSGAPEQKEERPLTPFQTEKDRLFASKCMELQSYIPSLSSILNGLRSGRYRERLSSFQESVAMDRIQRIMGVLQNPHMGERYVNIILKVEEMLKSWFPHVKPVVQHADKHTPGGEMEPLTKKQKFSPGALARPVVMVTPVSACVVHPAAAGLKGALCVRDLTPPGPYSATNLKWLHTSPICSLTSEQAQGASLRTTTTTTAAAAATATAMAALPAQRDQDLTQDNSVSSSTDAAMATVAGGGGGGSNNNNNNSNSSSSAGKTGGARSKTDSLSLRLPPPVAPGRPPLGKINAPCLERLLKATESIITQRSTGGVMGSGWS